VQSNLVLRPKRKRPVGQPCCIAPVTPEVGAAEALDLAAVARSLAEPVRVQLVDVLRRHPGKVCVCELTPLFDVGQPTVSHHLKVLREAGIVASERQGLWAYYYVLPDGLEELSQWLTS
jgi:ArsR family transcriptional regulator, arsenate/arsenite/antimonite-responsive transcriptional repressor